MAYDPAIAGVGCTLKLAQLVREAIRWRGLRQNKEFGPWMHGDKAPPCFHSGQYTVLNEMILPRRTISSSSSYDTIYDTLLTVLHTI